MCWTQCIFSTSAFCIIVLGSHSQLQPALRQQVELHCFASFLHKGERVVLKKKVSDMICLCIKPFFVIIFLLFLFFNIFKKLIMEGLSCLNI